MKTASDLLTLRAQTAADLMTSNPVSVCADATVGEASALLTQKGFHAAPVINEAGLPVGVLSCTDILIHAAHGGERIPVHEIMTPVVFSVVPHTPVAKVIDQLRDLRVHQLYVVDDSGVLVGVISTVDVVRHLGYSAGEEC